MSNVFFSLLLPLLLCSKHLQYSWPLERIACKKKKKRAKLTDGVFFTVTLLLIKSSLMAFWLEGANRHAATAVRPHAVHQAAACSADPVFDPHEVGI